MKTTQFYSLILLFLVFIIILCNTIITKNSILEKYDEFIKFNEQYKKKEVIYENKIKTLENQNDMLKELIKPPEIKGKVDMIGCEENNYITGIVAFAPNFGEFIYGNKFYILQIYCSNDKVYELRNDNFQNYHLNNYHLNKEQIYSNNDLTFFDKEKKSIVVKKEFICEINQSLAGVILTKITHEFRPICKKYKKIENTRENQKIYSLIYHPPSGVYKEKKSVICELNKYISHVILNNTSSNHICVNCVHDIEIICETRNEDNVNILFNGVKINNGYYIDKIDFISNKYVLKCNDCYKGGNENIFLCPKEKYLIGYNKWSDDVGMNGIQFICQ
jgi:hypothetical protein